MKINFLLLLFRFLLPIKDLSRSNSSFNLTKQVPFLFEQIFYPIDAASSNLLLQNFEI